ncbi:sensor histidine kinase [Enterococcus saccharolyticus]|uniref:sensor histidine kinase n=1 Tax=Enterococcus saccharolyticus TaxID=41997 RepID=UPI0039DF3A8B
MAIICVGLGVCLGISEMKRYLQKYALRELTQELKTIHENFGTNELVKTQVQSREMVDVVSSMNQLLLRHKDEQQLAIKKEQDLRREITNISHDLRTPLTAIKGFTELLQTDVSANDRQEYLTIIERKIALLSKLTDSFYLISQIESQDYPIQKELIDLNQLVIDLMMSFFEEFEQQAMVITVDEAKLPWIYLDEKATSRVVTNLIQNAIRYAHSYLRIIFIERDDVVQVTFINDVVDFDATQLVAIFDRSFSMDASRTKNQTGLRLYIVKKLMEKQQGEVSAQLKNNEFYLTLTFQK